MYAGAQKVLVQGVTMAPRSQGSERRSALGAERKQLMLVSSQELEQMAAQSYNKLKADAAGHGTLNTDGAMLQRVRAVAARLEPQTRTFRPDAPAWKWEGNG